MSIKITEIIPDDLPDWIKDAMMEGQLFNSMWGYIQALERDKEYLMKKLNKERKK